MPQLVNFATVAQFIISSRAYETPSGSTSSDELIESLFSRMPRQDKSSKAVMAELAVSVDELKKEIVETGERVFSSPTNQLASILQTVLAEHLTSRPVGISRLEMPFDKDDVRDVLEEARRRLRDVPKHSLKRPVSSQPDGVSDKFRIAVMSDFGTGLYGAPAISGLIEEYDKRIDLIVHLGDVYYSGEPHEVRDRLLKIWPGRDEALNRTLNGNHDMYSQGYGYFDVALPAFHQPSSYFSLQNDNFVLLFLDTAYVDNDLDEEQVEWIDAIMAGSGDRKAIFFSHHPLFSNFKPQGYSLRVKLQKWLMSGRVKAWFWGHEHNCVLYDPDPHSGVIARCLGNGGMPSPRKRLSDFKVKVVLGDLCWRRAKQSECPRCLYLDGPNELIPSASDKYIPHSFAVLKFDGPDLSEKIFSATGELLYSDSLK